MFSFEDKNHFNDEFTINLGLNGLNFAFTIMDYETREVLRDTERARWSVFLEQRHNL